MSAALLGLAFRARVGNPIAKLVLVKLVDCCRDDGAKIFPSVATVAEAAECSERQVQRVLKGFIESGLLRVVAAGGGRGHATEYALDVRRLVEMGLENEPSKKGDTPSPFEEPVNGDVVSPFEVERVTPATRKGDPQSPYPLREPLYPLYPPQRPSPGEGQGQSGRRAIAKTDPTWSTYASAYRRRHGRSPPVATLTIDGVACEGWRFEDALLDLPPIRRATAPLTPRPPSERVLPAAP